MLSWNVFTVKPLQETLHQPKGQKKKSRSETREALICQMRIRIERKLNSFIIQQLTATQHLQSSSLSYMQQGKMVSFGRANRKCVIHSCKAQIKSEVEQQRGLVCDK